MLEQSKRWARCIRSRERARCIRSRLQHNVKPVVLEDGHIISARYGRLPQVKEEEALTLLRGRGRMARRARTSAIWGSLLEAVCGRDAFGGGGGVGRGAVPACAECVRVSGGDVV